MSPIELFVAIRDRHTSVTSALADPALAEKSTPKAVRKLFELIRDTPFDLIRREGLDRLFRREALPDALEFRAKVAVVGRKLLRREPKSMIGWDGTMHRRYDMVSIRRIVERAVEKWTVAPSLQVALARRYPTATITSVHYPWYGDTRYFTLLGDGFVMGTFRVMEADADGPRRVQILRRDDPQFQADIAASTTLPDRIRTERQDMSEARGGTDFCGRPEVCANLRRLGLDQVIDVSRLPEVYAVLLSPFTVSPERVDTVVNE